jgi:fibro-slime domain-containing protein
MKCADRARVLAALVGGVPAVALAACGPSGLPDDDEAQVADGGRDGQASVSIDATLDDAPPAAPDCRALQATVRDFHRTHPDFETFTRNEIYPGIVQALLGSDHKPVYAATGATPHTTGPAEFAQWYRDVDGVNQAIARTISLTETSTGVYAYDSDFFFPIDGMGFGYEGFRHNFHFTTEIHTFFRYQGGEVFTFRGDDDLWMFINGKLAIDLGGLHEPAMQTLDMDARAGDLGLTVGATYPMEIFHAERHTIASTFHIETTIDCFIIE